MLGNFLSDCRNIKVKHATTDGDAIIVIVARALKAAQTYSEVLIYSEDTYNINFFPISPNSSLLESVILNNLISFCNSSEWAIILNGFTFPIP